MMNWRKPILWAGCYLSGSNILRNLRELEKIEGFSNEEVDKYQKEKLNKILLYAAKKVPYYRRVLADSRVVVEGKVILENFNKIPILTKDIIRREGNNLFSDDYPKKRFYENTSGGSTGQPIRIIQDKEYSDWNIANKIYLKTFGGQDIGGKELRLWGSERDLLEGKESLAIRLRNWLYNRREFNSFKMSEEDMWGFVRAWNRFRPRWIEAYVQSIYEFSVFIQKNGIEIYSPKGILTSAGTLFPEMKEKIEAVFKTKVFNRYGSREVGDMACSCEKDEGLHLLVSSHYFEISDGAFQECESGKFGQVYVTTLNNYSMPLIRYDIGDIAMPAEKQKCSCGRGMPLIGFVKGRVNSMIRTKKGVFDSVAVTSLLYFYEKNIPFRAFSKYQIVQKALDKILFKVVIIDGGRWKKEKQRIKNKFSSTFGDDVEVIFKEQSKIEASSSGKYQYVISEVE